MGRLDDASIVVTGAGSGLGRALLERFVAEGARVVAFDKSEDKLDKLAAAFDTSIATVSGDVTDYDDNLRACTTAVEKFGKIDTFVGNAGLWDFNGSLQATAPDRLDAGFDELFSVNVKGYLLGAKAAQPLLERSGGSIIFTLSNGAFFPGGGGPLYVASKHAGVGLVKQLAYELAPAVRVNAVAPGGMNTDLRGPASLGLTDIAIGQAIPVDQYGKQFSALKFAPSAEDYVGAYVLLAAKDESRTVTGTVIDVSSFGIPARPPAE